MSKDIKTFKAIGEYKYPGLPARKYAKRVYSRLLQIFNSDDEQAFISDDKLSKTDQDLISKIVTLPSYGGLMTELDCTIKDWFHNSGFNNRLIILPPGDDDLIATWASEQKAYILPTPSREYLLSGLNDYKFEIPTDKDLVVIPRLERWFLRHHNGLHVVHNLLGQLQTSEVKCLIGCNSWAHQFLKKATNSQFVLPNGLMFEPYDANRLCEWFNDMAAHSEIHNISFKSSKTGENVFKKNKDDEFEDSFLKELSANSLGIPWIAWELWRKALNSEDEESANNKKDEESASEHETTLWLAALDEFTLPGTDDQGALLALHALLLHCELSFDELELVLPVIKQSNVIYSLINAGFVIQKDNQSLICNRAAYPSIRNSLASAGFPMDTL